MVSLFTVASPERSPKANQKIAALESKSTPKRFLWSTQHHHINQSNVHQKCDMEFITTLMDHGNMFTQAWLLMQPAWVPCKIMVGIRLMFVTTHHSTFW